MLSLCHDPDSRCFSRSAYFNTVISGFVIWHNSNIVFSQDYQRRYTLGNIKKQDNCCVDYVLGDVTGILLDKSIQLEI
jgi:hypothetical protein